MGDAPGSHETRPDSQQEIRPQRTMTLLQMLTVTICTLLISHCCVGADSRGSKKGDSCRHHRQPRTRRGKGRKKRQSRPAHRQQTRRVVVPMGDRTSRPAHSAGKPDSRPSHRSPQTDTNRFYDNKTYHRRPLPSFTPIEVTPMPSTESPSAAPVFPPEPPTATPSSSPSTGVPTNLDSTDKDQLGVYGLQPSCNMNDSSKYDICLDLVSSTGVYQPWMDAVVRAKQRWEQVILGDVPGRDASDLPSDPVMPGSLNLSFCDGYPQFIDDIYICVQDAIIDGPGNVLGGAIVLESREVTGSVNPQTGRPFQIPLTGFMIFDLDDIDRVSMSSLEFLIRHEIGHTLGIGSVWEGNGLYMAGSDAYANNTAAQREWNSLGCSGPLPVELDGASGTMGSHFDEACLKNELMTGFLGQGEVSPLSRITVGTLEDIGYVVDYTAADPFTSKDLGVCGSSCPESRRLRSPAKRRRRSLSSSELEYVTKYANERLSLLRRAAPPDLPEEVVFLGGRSMDVFYLDADGELHIISVKGSF